MEKYIDYAKHINASSEVLKWIDTNLSNFLNKYNGENGTKNLENQDEIEHIIDYLSSDKAPKNMHKMAYNEAKTNTDKWNNALIKKGSKILEVDSDTAMIKDFNDGFKIVKLVGKNAFEREGYLMRHCVASYFNYNTEIYSLRDKDNMPHCTMEKDQQIKGKGNGSISPKYINYIISFLEEVGMSVGDNEMKNLGYVNIEKIKDKLHKDTKFVNENYLSDDEEFIGKDGNDFLSLDLLDIKPLIKNTSTSLKINFELPKLLKASFEYMKNNFDDVIDSSGNSAQNASSGDYAQNASSGYSAQNASSGNYAKNASSGDYAKNASSGYSAKNASSGYSAKNASSGNYAQNASSGDYAKNASSGDYAKNASSGNYAQNASSGDYAKNASSGYYATEITTGKNSVTAAIGRNSKIKAIIGTWITLAEYDDEGIVKLVKSAQIDGKILKEDVFYQLIDGEFSEVS